MNILVFEQRYTSPKEAGIGRFYGFAREWIKLGHKVTVISGAVSYISGKGEKSRTFPWKKETENGITVWRVFDKTLGYRTFAGRLWSYTAYWKLGMLLALFVKKPDVVIASSPPISVGVMGILTSFFRKSKFIFEVRDLWPDEAVELGFLKNKTLIKLSRWLEKKLYAGADHIVGNSPGIKEFLVRKKGVAEEKISVIPNPVDPGEFSMGAEEDIGALYLGAMSAVYDFDMVLDAAEKLPGVKFFLVGDGRQRRGVEEKIEKMKLGNVSCLGPVPQAKVPEIIRRASVCIAPLKGIPLLKYVYATKTITYMAGGKPVVLAMEGVTSDLVCKLAGGGICVRPGEKEKFAQAIKDLIGDKKLREKLGTSGREYVRENFDVGRLARDYIRACEFA